FPLPRVACCGAPCTRRRASGSPRRSVAAGLAAATVAAWPALPPTRSAFAAGSGPSAHGAAGRRHLGPPTRTHSRRSAPPPVHSPDGRGTVPRPEIHPIIIGPPILVKICHIGRIHI